MALKPVIGVSACLLGWHVRFDGTEKNIQLNHRLLNQFEWKPLCPEMEAGLGVPRDPIQWERHEKRILLRQNGRCIEPQLEDAIQRILTIPVDGFLLKSKSPSCSPTGLPVFEENMKVAQTGPGLWVREILKMDPDCPIIDEIAWQDSKLQGNFLEQVIFRSKQKEGHNA